MYRAAVVTAWTGSGTDINDANRPQLLSDHIGIVQCRDITGQPAENIKPAPNEYTVQVECTEAVLAAIEADPTYEILWSEEIIEGPI